MLEPESYIPKTKKVEKKVRMFGAEGRVLSAITEESSVLAESVASRSTAGGGPSLDRDMSELSAAVLRRVKRGAHAAARAIASSQRVGLCFLLDTTGSMSSWITQCKDSIDTIVSSLVDQGCRVDGVAFVGYKDWW
jgi:hypothetical protein